MTPISVAGRSGGASPQAAFKRGLQSGTRDPALKVPGQVAGFLSLRGEGDLRRADFSKMAVVPENILVAAQDGARDDRIIGVADFTNRILDDVCFFGHIMNGERSLLS